MIVKDLKTGGFYRKVEVKCEVCEKIRKISWHYAKQNSKHICRSCSSREQTERDPTKNKARLESMAKGLREKALANPIHLRRSGKYTAVYVPDHPRVKNRAERQKKPAPYVLEHILVMEEKLDDIIPEHQFVHHINNQPADNRIENLYLCAGKTRKESSQIHNQAHTSAAQLTMNLVDSGVTVFKDGEYYLAGWLVKLLKEL